MLHYNIKINSYIDTELTTEESVLEKAKDLVKKLDRKNNLFTNEKIVTKLYYISPLIGKLYVLVTEEDAKILGLEKTILLNTNIKDYSYSKLPSKIIVYKELIIKKGQNITAEDELNLAQAIADKTFKEVSPFQLPIVKIINYNDDSTTIVLPSIFGNNVFRVDETVEVTTAGDSEAGQKAIDNYVVTTEDNGITWYAIRHFSLGSDNDKNRRKFFVGRAANKINYEEDSIHVASYKSDDQRTKSPNEIQAPLYNLNPKEFVRVLISLYSYGNYYKYEFKILDENDNLIFNKYSNGNGAKNGIKTPHKEFFYAYLPIPREKAKYCFGEAWGQSYKIKAIDIVSELPTTETTDGYQNCLFI